MRPTYVGLLEYKRHTSWELCGFQTVTEVFFSFIVPRLLVDQQLLVDNTDSLLTLKIWDAESSDPYLQFSAQASRPMVPWSSAAYCAHMAPAAADLAAHTWRSKVVVRVRKRLGVNGVMLWNTIFDKQGFSMQQGDHYQAYSGGLLCSIHRPHLSQIVIAEPRREEPQRTDAEQGLTCPVIGIAARLPVSSPT